MSRDRRRVTLTVALTLALTLTACTTAATPGTSGAPASFAPSSATSAVPGVSASSIRLGLQVDLTGGGALVGQGTKFGVDLAVAQINKAGGINGRTLELVVEDSASTPDGGVLAVRKLVQQDNVFAIIGGGTSSSTVSALPFIRQNDVPYYASIPSDPRVLDPLSKLIFEGAALPQTTVVPLEVDFLVKRLNAKNIALAVSSDAYAISAKGLIVPELQKRGLSVKTTQDFTATDTDFTAQIQAIKAASPDVVMTIGLPASGARFLVQARRAGISVPMVGDSAQADNQTISLAGSSAEGYYTFWFSSPQFIDATAGAMGDWLKAFKAQFSSPPPGVPNQWTLQAYSDVFVVAQALVNVGKDPIRTGFVEQVEKTRCYVGGRDGFVGVANAVGLPRSFSTQNHQGSYTLIPIAVKGGHFEAAGDPLVGEGSPCK